MKQIYLIISASLLVGCTVVQEKADTYKNIVEKASNPDRVCIVYERNGEILSGMEYRCFGSACDNFSGCSPKNAE